MEERPTLVCIDYQALSAHPRSVRNEVLRAHLAAAPLRGLRNVLLVAVLAALPGGRDTFLLLAAAMIALFFTVRLELHYHRLRARFGRAQGSARGR